MVISLLTILAPVTCITVSVSGPDIISDNFFFSFFLESQWVIDFQTYKDDLLIHYIIIQRNMFFLGHLVCIHLLCDQLRNVYRISGYHFIFYVISMIITFFLWEISVVPLVQECDPSSSMDFLVDLGPELSWINIIHNLQ